MILNLAASELDLNRRFNLNWFGLHGPDLLIADHVQLPLDFISGQFFQIGQRLDTFEGVFLLELGVGFIADQHLWTIRAKSVSGRLLLLDHLKQSMLQLRQLVLFSMVQVRLVHI